MNVYKPGELFVYANGSRWELGQVKRVAVEGESYFCWYSLGDTVARTLVEHMHKLENAGFSHAECLSVGAILSHVPGMTHVEIQTEEDEADCVCSYEGPAMYCPDELRALAVDIFSPHTYLERNYLRIRVR